VILGSVSAVLILMFVASFFKKNSTYAAFNTLISVAIGFVIGRSSDICKSYPRLTHCGYDKKCACQSVH
jgi:uncharacterized membrane protein